MGEIIPIKEDSVVSDGLTPIHSSIHCPDTEDAGCYCEGMTERNRIDIENFINTLADITVSIVQREHKGGVCGQ